MICGVQIEAHFVGVRDTPANRDRFGDVTATVLANYLGTHWAIAFGTLMSLMNADGLGASR